VTVQFVDASVCLPGDSLPHERLHGGAANRRKKTMKLILNCELQKRSESELSALFCTVSKGLVRTKRGSPERRNALASLENISLARAARMQGYPP
jgi:hypothetical protein